MFMTAAMVAAAHGDATALRAAIKEGGCELEARDDEHGTTAFLVACHKGCVECMKLLADAGCDTAATNNIGQTALMLSGSSGVPAAVRLAMEKNWGELDGRLHRWAYARLMERVDAQIGVIVDALDASGQAE